MSKQSFSLILVFWAYFPVTYIGNFMPLLQHAGWVGAELALNFHGVISIYIFMMTSVLQMTNKLAK